MTISVTLVVEGGQPVAVKHARDRGRAHRLEREAALLQQVRHPGVVELVRWHRDGDRAALVTRFAGRSVAASGPFSADVVAGLIGALASTVADLHELGLVHGRIDPCHVLVGSSGAPVLCGFSAAGRAGETVDGRALDPRDDIVGLGTLLSHVLADATGRPHDIRSLRRLADQATADDDAATRPTAAELAERISGLMPTARDRDGADRADTPVGRQARRRVLAIGAGGVVLLLLGAIAWRRSDPVDRRAVGRATAACEASIGSSVDVDGDGCADEIRVADGIVEVGDRRFTAGTVGDQIAVGDWDCDGQATPAVLRPTTGEVFVFPRWTDPSGRVVVSAETTVVGATALRPVSAPGRTCPLLVVDRASGPSVTVTR
ncbi:MAG: hypothetical protein ACRD0U_10195 [Acidimicrobiales bacterium]